MEINWSNMSNEELRTALSDITIELIERDKAIKDFRNEYPKACWMVETEDDDGFPYEINLFDYNLDTNLITT